MNILVTGGSSGFGKLAIPLLLKRGHNVVAAVRGGATRLESIFINELKTYPGKLHALDLHLEKPESFEVAAQWVQQNFDGKLDVLLNNAGYGLFGPFEEQTPEQLRHQFEVNFFGPILLTRALLPSLRAAKGRVINVSSIAGLFAFPFYGSYNASKFALDAATEALHYELKPFGVQTALIEPGAFKTDFNTRSKIFAEGLSNPASPYYTRGQSMKHFLEHVTDRQGNPMKVARLMVRLCEQKKIPLRNLAGADARVMVWASKLIPDWFRVSATDKACRKLFFKE